MKLEINKRMADNKVSQLEEEVANLKLQVTFLENIFEKAKQAIYKDDKLEKERIEKEDEERRFAGKRASSNKKFLDNAVNHMCMLHDEQLKTYFDENSQVKLPVENNQQAVNRHSIEDFLRKFSIDNKLKANERKEAIANMKQKAEKESLRKDKLRKEYSKKKVYCRISWKFIEHENGNYPHYSFTFTNQDDGSNFLMDGKYEEDTGVVYNIKGLIRFMKYHDFLDEYEYNDTNWTCYVEWEDLWDNARKVNYYNADFDGDMIVIGALMVEAL